MEADEPSEVDAEGRPTAEDGEPDPVGIRELSIDRAAEPNVVPALMVVEAPRIDEPLTAADAEKLVTGGWLTEAAGA